MKSTMHRENTAWKLKGKNALYFENSSSQFLNFILVEHFRYTQICAGVICYDDLEPINIYIMIKYGPKCY